MRRPKKRFKRSVIGLLHKLQTKEKSRTVPWLYNRHALEQVREFRLGDSLRLLVAVYEALLCFIAVDPQSNSAIC